VLIGQFNDSFPPITDGVAYVVRNYAHWITKAASPADRCVVVTPDAPHHTDDQECFEIVRYASLPFLLRPPYRLGMPHLDGPFRMRLEGIPFDLVHAHTPFSSGLIAASYARRHDLPLVATFHTKYRDDFLPIVRSPAIADAMIREVVRFFDRADAVWSVNEASAGTLREYGFKGPITVVRNGTDLEPADPSHRRSPVCESLCRSLRIPADETVFLFVGQHIWQKNVRLLIESLALVKSGLEKRSGGPARDGRPAFRMLFVGGGQAEKEMQELVESLGLSHETRFLGVVRDREILRGIFERADLFLFPSIYDNSSLVLREAASALCPAVVVAGSNNAEGIVDGVNGFLTKETPQDFARRILLALEDRGRLQEAGRGAQRDFHRPWSVVASEALDQYREIRERYASNRVRKGSKSSRSGLHRKRSGSISPSSDTSTPSDESSAT
jgi:1,2-diacylglycerol 3-alpha-glucosyltransferase